MKPLSIRVALGEYDTAWHDPQTSLDRAEMIVAAAANQKADLVVLPEMCASGFTMEAARYTESLGGASATRLSALARHSGVHLIAGLATREEETFYNSLLLFDRGGDLVAQYRKQRLFGFARENETYTPGDRPVVATIESLRVALFVCFDLRFPELFRRVAPYVDLIVVSANWPEKRQMHWDTLLRARAIESQAFVAGVNRIGQGGDLHYSGGSVIYDPWGEEIARAKNDVAIGTVDRDAVTNAREKFPFVEDRRNNELAPGAGNENPIPDSWPA